MLGRSWKLKKANTRSAVQQCRSQLLDIHEDFYEYHITGGKIVCINF
jgi:hypothetical protein